MGNSTLAIVSTVLWAFNGWFQGFLAPSSAVAITNWFSPKERGFVYGVWSASHSIGEGVNFVVTSALVTSMIPNTSLARSRAIASEDPTATISVRHAAGSLNSGR